MSTLFFGVIGRELVSRWFLARLAVFLEKEDHNIDVKSFIAAKSGLSSTKTSLGLLFATLASAFCGLAFMTNDISRSCANCSMVDFSGTLTSKFLFFLSSSMWRDLLF